MEVVRKAALKTFDRYILKDTTVILKFCKFLVFLIKDTTAVSIFCKNSFKNSIVLLQFISKSGQNDCGILN